MLFADTDPVTDHILTPVMQLGFAGAFIVATSIMVWLMKSRREDWRSWMDRLCSLQEQTNKVITANTEAFRGVVDSQERLCEKIMDNNTMTQRLYESLISRPCLLPDPRHHTG